MPRTPALDRSILEAALVGLEAQRQRLDEHIVRVRSLVGHRGPGRPQSTTATAASKTPRKRRRKLSAKGRAAIVAALKKRWAAVRKQQKAAKAK